MPNASDWNASAIAVSGLSRGGSYGTAEDLLDDLRGRSGETRRFLATGYAMAIHDSDVSSLSGDELLAHLQGKNGEDMRLVGTGYVACVRDALDSREVGSPQKRARLVSPSDGEIDRVVRWLQSHPRHGADVAAHAVRAALGCELARERMSVAGRWRIRSAVGWCAATAGTLALAAIVAVHPWRTGRDAQSTHDFRLSQQASDIQTLILEERRYEKDTFLNIADRTQLASYARKWDDSRLLLTRTIASARELALTEQDRKAIQQIDADFARYVDGFEGVLSRIRAGQVTSAEEANAQLTAYKDAVHRIEANAEALNSGALQRLPSTT